MSSADAVSVSVASSSSTSASLPPSSSGTTHVDPHSELHAPHSTPSTHVLSNSHTNTVDAVLDSPVTNLTSDVGENAFMIVEGESQDGSVDDAGHESVDVQGREGVMVMDSGDDGQQWFPEHENHELKRVKVRLFPRRFSVRFLCARVVPVPHTREALTRPFIFLRSMNSSIRVGSTKALRCVLVNTKMAKQPSSRKRRQTCQRSSSRQRFVPVTCISASKVGRFTRSSCPVLFGRVFIEFPCSDTLIVWTEPDGVDYALSFQDPEGCMELWNFILEVQNLRANSGGAWHLFLALSYGTFSERSVCLKISKPSRRLR